MKRMMKSNWQLIVLIIAFSSVSVRGDTFVKGLGVSFGSPALVGWRFYAQEQPLSPWALQLEYSRQKIEKNRGQGFLSFVRCDVQRQLSLWQGLQPFAFGGGTYFEGFTHESEPRARVFAIQAGMGINLPLSERWSLSGEIGGLVPTHSVSGWEYWVGIINLGLRWSWGPETSSTKID